MPSETIYFKHDHLLIVEQIIQDVDGVENTSQAVQEALEQYE
jgi:hypothetical protein